MRYAALVAAVSAAGAVRDAPARSRFELEEGGRLAYADYRREGGDVLVIPHVYADPALRGGGAAGRLMQGVAEHARDAGLKIMPVCPYAAVWMRRHPETADLLA